MASTGSESFAPVLSALSVLQSSVERTQKSQAHDYLERFQKSVRITPIVIVRERHVDRSKLIARSLDNNTFHPIYPRCHTGGQVICRHYIERKGEHTSATSIY